VVTGGRGGAVTPGVVTGNLQVPRIPPTGLPAAGLVKWPLISCGTQSKHSNTSRFSNRRTQMFNSLRYSVRRQSCSHDID